ncbi:MAG: SPFH domain-containing protein [Acholeplasmataceae bacterium]|nr:SPFH domain-containing protein [Acholeplasmataceae bacterium]
MKTTITYQRGEANNFIWKHPSSTFDLPTELIVIESDIAVICLHNKILHTFHPGTHQLTKELLAFSDESLNSQLFFISNKVHQDIKWGTPSKINYCDPESGIYVNIGASGKFSIRVNSPERFINHFAEIANTKSGDLSFDNNEITSMLNKFKQLVINGVRNNLVKIIRENAICILQLDEYLDKVSRILKNNINNELSEYGLFMPEFFIETIQTPDDDPQFRELKKQQASHYLDVHRAEVRARVSHIDTIAKEERGLTEAKIMLEKNKASLFEHPEKLTITGDLIFNNSGIIAKNDAIVNRSNVSAEVEESHSGNTFCISCGAKIPNLAVFCPSCGKKLE